MTIRPDPPAPRDKPAGDIAAQRICLRCKTLFQSAGFGERVCGRCKASTTWRSVAPGVGGQGRSGNARRAV